MTFTPSPAQQAFYDWVDNDTGHAILEAVAGAGKTTTILNGIAMMPGRAWFGVYNRKMATEIKEKIQADFPQLQDRGRDLDTSTFHSLGMKIWLWNNKGAKIDVDEKKTWKIVEGLIQEQEARDPQLNKRDDLREVAGMICGIVSMAKNRGIGFIAPNDDATWITMIEHFDLDSRLPEGVDMDMILKFSRATLSRSRTKSVEVIDYDDMIYMPLDPKCKVWKYDWVLVDEAQDTNPARRALATRILKPGTGRFVAVGDPRQAIFGFTGADNDSLEQIQAQFDAKVLPLTVTYRCPRKIVAHAQKWVSHLTAHESAPEGSVEEMPYADLLANIRESDVIDHNETAVLCRYNKYLVGLCFKLIRNGIAAKIEGRSIGEGLSKLATRWTTCKTINALENKLREFQEKEVAKAMAKDQEDKADRIIDETETLIVMIEKCRADGKDRVTDLVTMIDDMFEDNVASKGLLTLCSAHKSKGLEWDTVFLLGRKEFMPSKMAQQDWQIMQEENLIYVAVTRAKRRLIEVTGVVAEKDSTE